jgi:hypothetical protein
LRSIAGIALLVFTAESFIAPPAFAQRRRRADQPKAAAALDEEKDADPNSKTAPVSDRETIGFSQQNAAAQMNELEERMFRLSEALRGLEPENASRLRLALKFSREEQILEQMRETYKLLKDAQLSKAETEVKELIAKLEHLRNLLLAEDLDFQLKLARLRQMRETLGQLDRIVKEQRRELGWSRFAIEQRKRLERFNTRRGDLESLVRDQESLVSDTKKLSKGDDASAKSGRAAIRSREGKVRDAASGLANDPLFADLQPRHLRRADGALAEVMALLEKADPNAAALAEDKALGMMRDALRRVDDETKQTKRAIAEAEFRRRAGDQGKNRGTAETLQETSARLGDVGVSLRKDLIRASASMKTAEQSLGKIAAAPAAEDQTAALDILSGAREEFLRSIERLLVELRAELQTRLITDFTEFHEIQTAIRESTQAQAPKVLRKSRSALVTVAGLSKNEAGLAERTEHLLALVEETEFGIALPTTLRIFSREMRDIENRLKAGDVASRTVGLETRLEEDLLGLMLAVRRLPPTTPPAPGSGLPADGRERERELNRMIAELKMVRMIQARLNDDTIGVDQSRQVASITVPAIRREVETLETRQDEIRDALAKISERLPFPQTNP